MRPSSFGWLRAAVFVSAVAFSACSDGGSSGTASCTPACRDGFACVSGTCVSACNPACGAGELCVTRAGVPVCATLITPDGSTDDIVDATTPGDTTQPPTDVTLPDGNVPDTVTPPTDVGSVDGGVRPPCGMTGQPCCNTYACTGNNFCNSSTMRCQAFTPETDECTTTAVCPAGRVCGFGARCSGGERSCLRCIAPDAMGSPEGAACNLPMTAFCANNLCVSAACRTACALGPAGDAACRALNPNSACAEFSSTPIAPDGGVGPTTLLGACVPTCLRDADCTGGLRCGMSGQGINDTLLLYCRRSFGTLPSGAVCPMTPSSLSDPTMFCQSSQCLAQMGSSTMGNCTAFCATDADCPAVFPRCRETPFFRPSYPVATSTVPIRMCDR
jgi:hypothetical protein